MGLSKSRYLNNFLQVNAVQVLIRYPEVWMKDFIGERSFSHPVPHNKDQEPRYDLGDIRQVCITNYNVCLFLFC